MFRGRFRSELVRDERRLPYLLAYIHLNPLRANLVTRLDSPDALRTLQGGWRPGRWASTRQRPKPRADARPPIPRNEGGFSFSEAQCRDIVDGAIAAFAGLRPLFPVPAKGMQVERIQELVRFYGLDSIRLIGSDLHRQGGRPHGELPEIRGPCRDRRSIRSH